MSQKIILFVSSLPRTELKRERYVCPDGSVVEGAQTNEAPVRFLLEQFPDTSQIIAIVTPEAKPAYDYLQDTLKERWPELSLCQVPYEEGQDFNGEPLTAIMRQVQPGDTILLETTGGFRNAVMYLLLLSRVLSYVGVRTVYAVYSNYPKRQIENVSELIGLFELVGGMQELSSFGSARTLRIYYGQEPKDPAIGELLTALEQLNETITLCRTTQLGERMKRFNLALEGAKACEDPLMRELLPAFQGKFGKKLNTVSLIRWCVESDMIQQALTVYTERIPTLILTRGDLLRWDRELAPPVPRQEYEDENVAQFLKGFLMLASHGTGPASDGVQRLREYVPTHGREIIKISRGEALPVPEGLERAVENLALIVRLAYPDGGNFCETWPDQLPPGKEALAQLSHFPNWAYSPQGMLNNVGVFKRAYLELLLEEDAAPAIPEGKGTYLSTLRHLEQLLPGSGYQVLCPMDQMETIVRDYLYIKSLRNLANHANDTGGANQLAIMEELGPYGYPPLETVTLKQIGQIILSALDHLRTRRGSRKE